MQSLKYLDYELINDEQRADAKAKYSEEFTDKDKNSNAEENEKSVDQDLIDAKIDCTEKMLEAI